MGRNSRFAAASILLLCALAGAQGLLTPGEQVLRELRAALDGDDEARAVSLLAEVGAICRYPASVEEARALLALAGRAAADPRRAVALAALKAIGDAGMREGAEHLKPFLWKLKTRPEELALTLAAVQAAGRVRAETLVPRLLELAKTGSHLTVADQALGALAEFCRAPIATRKNVAGKVLGVCRSLSGNRSRWRRLRAPGLRALQRLMGRRLNSVQQFQDWWEIAKSRKDPFATAFAGPR